MEQRIRALDVGARHERADRAKAPSSPQRSISMSTAVPLYVIGAPTR